MSICTKCGRTNAGLYHYFSSKKNLCNDCYKEEETNRLNIIKKSITKTSDWAVHSKEDMSEIFWRELALYVKHPNRKSLSLIHRCMLWAAHDDHALANSLHNALKWAKLDLYNEFQRKDLPEDYSEE